MVTNLDRYATQAFEFFDRLAAVQSTAEVADALVSEMKTLGYEYLTVWSVPPPGSPLSGIMLNTRPSAFVQHYVESNHVLRDPVVTHLRRTLRTYSWSDVRSSRALTKGEVRIMDEARDFGITDGLTIPIITATNSLAVVSPCGRSPDLADRARSAINMIGIVGHQALKRLQQRGPQPEPALASLPPREREIMQYIAIGKTDNEISDILNISATTVLTHVERAKRKLGTPKRSVAVIIALQRGEISL